MKELYRVELVSTKYDIVFKVSYFVELVDALKEASDLQEQSSENTIIRFYCGKHLITSQFGGQGNRAGEKNANIHD